MRRMRNPRYAPEFLERRLHPDTSIGAMVPVLVYTSTTVVPDDGMPPAPLPPPPTTGPAGPALVPPTILV